MTYSQAVILGLVQGLAEFLPISSSGHLTILQTLFGVEEGNILLFSICLHLGTLISVFVIFWKDIKELFIELFATIKDLVTGKGLCLEGNNLRKFGCMIIVSCIPTAILGFVFEDLFSSMYSNLLWVASGLILTGILLWVSEKKEGRNDIERMNFRNAFFVGTVQGLALWPGLSRSGTTLFGSLFCNLERKFAVKYVFIISIPPILGSAILEFPDAIRQGIGFDYIGQIIVGMLVAFISGIIAIKFMIKMVADKKLKYFSFYVWAVALFVIIYTLVNFI